MLRQQGGIIERPGFSDYAKLLSDQSSLYQWEIVLAEITVSLTETKIVPGWMVFNRRNNKLYAVVPRGSGRFELDFHQEQALDMLSILYSQEFH